MPKKNPFLNGRCKAPKCKKRTVAHDLPMCTEHWYSIAQDDRTWYIDGDGPYLSYDPEGRLPELLFRGGFETASTGSPV